MSSNKFHAKKTQQGVRNDPRYSPVPGGIKEPRRVKSGVAYAVLPWPPVREYLELFYAEGKTTTEIAALYGCADVTIRQYRKKLAVHRESISLKERFYAKVRQSPSGCWEWLGARMPAGYGLFGCNLPNHHRTAKAHRISWEIANNASLLPGALIMHSCDNPSCVNPEHLELGNHKENMRQAIERGRWTGKRGEQAVRAILTEEIVRAARERFASGESIPKLAEEYGISYPGLYNAVRGRSWSWLD